MHAIGAGRPARFGLPLMMGLAACTSANTPAAGSDATAPAVADAGRDTFVLATEDAECDSTQTISASSFDQSCTTDVDCVAVGQGSVCYPCEIACPSAAIRVSALGAYRASVADLWSAAGQQDPPQVGCGCPNYGTPCCLAGQCSERCNDGIVDPGACAAGGGTCVTYAAWLDGGAACTRLSFCGDVQNPTQLSVCCPVAMADAGAGD